ncbi:FtsX-like permease family protein [Halobaculum sp. EA56]|uniref:FtsX-like permease family protein n=1 Tax=Halobaculum sp. EA56 TaxID=3421648 RepID=UPI003EBACAD9
MRDTGLVGRWSRRDWLSVAVIAATTAFLVGTALLLLSAGAYTSTLEGGLATTAVAEYSDGSVAFGSEDPDRIVVQTAVVDADGEQARLIGVPATAPTVVPGASVAWKPARLPQPTTETAVGPVAYRHTVEFVGSSGTVTRDVRPYDNESVFPTRWYAARPDALEAVGVGGAFVIYPNATDTPTDLEEGVPLIGTIPFIVLGIRDVLSILSFAGVAGAVVVVVVVYSVTRMSVRDRRTTIRVLRSTGADPVRVGGLITARAVAITGTGIGLGVAAGIAAPSGLVTAAQLAGLPVTLPTGLTLEKLRMTGFITSVLLLGGGLAGVAAAVPSIRAPPAKLATEVGHRPGPSRSDPERTTRSDGGQSTNGPTTLRGVLRPTLLGWRTAVPTAATLAVFILIVLLVGGLVGTLTPLTGEATGTITEQGSAHPLNSRMDADYARVLRSQGIAASPEVISAQVTDGTPYLARGANYTAFEEVTGARLIEGRAPEEPDEAVIGDGLARTLGVQVGDSMTLGGSVSPHLDRVTIVGRYQAPGIVDDQLIVSRETVAPAATGNADRVHLIRTEAAAADILGGDATDEPQLVITRVRTPDAVLTDEPATIAVSVRNFGGRAGTRTVEVVAGDQVFARTVELDAGTTETVRVNVTWNQSGSYPVTVGPFESTVRVVRAGELTLPPEFPTRAPPGSTLLIPAVTTDGTRLDNATVRFGEFTAPTNAEGIATLPVPDNSGMYPVVIESPRHGEFRTSVNVTPNATRDLRARIRIDPETGSPVTRPNISVVVGNPWGTTLVRNLTLVMPTGTEERTVRVPPGNISRVRVEPGAAGLDGEVTPGTYTFRLLVEGDLVATARYEVVGSAVSVSGSTLPAADAEYEGGSGLGTVIMRVFGNVQVLFAGMVLLAGVSTVSGTVAAFARAVQSRRRTIGVYRATGMTRRQLLSLLIGDAIRLAVPAVATALFAASVTAFVAARFDLFVAFGVRIDLPFLSWPVAVAVIGSVLLAIGSVCLAAFPYLAAPPARLLTRDE